MTDEELDAIVERAKDPLLIPGIYNWCDRRCEKCAFTARCFQYRLARAEGGPLEGGSRQDRPRNRDDTLPAQVGGAINRTIELIRAVARRMGMDVAELDRAMDEGPPADDTYRMDAAGDDPLVALACRYAADVHPIVRVLEPVVALRGDQASIDAVQDIDWHATLVCSKTFRAVLSAMESEHEIARGAVAADASDAENGFRLDARGSAKCARLFIAASIRAWRVLMEVGRATADGVPARLVQVLTDLDRGLAARFPDAMTFVRPGFDDVEAASPADAHAVAPPGRPRLSAMRSLAEVKIEQ